MLILHNFYLRIISGGNKRHPQRLQKVSVNGWTLNSEPERDVPPLPRSIVLSCPSTERRASQNITIRRFTPDSFFLDLLHASKIFTARFANIQLLFYILNCTWKHLRQSTLTTTVNKRVWVVGIIRYFSAQEHKIGKAVVWVKGTSRSVDMTLVEVWPFLYTMNLKTHSLEPDGPPVWPWEIVDVRTRGDVFRLPPGKNTPRLNLRILAAGCEKY